MDVRAPVEFAKGAFPRSVNLPLMSDEERHLVGIRYKESGQDSAIELGAELLTPAIRCLLYTSPSPRDKRQSRMPSSA